MALKKQVGLRGQGAEPYTISRRHSIAQSHWPYSLSRAKLQANALYASAYAKEGGPNTMDTCFFISDATWIYDEDLYQRISDAISRLTAQGNPVLFLVESHEWSFDREIVSPSDVYYRVLKDIKASCPGGNVSIGYLYHSPEEDMPIYPGYENFDRLTLSNQDQLIKIPDMPCKSEKTLVWSKIRWEHRWILEQCTCLISYQYQLLDKGDASMDLSLGRRKNIPIQDVANPQTAKKAQALLESDLLKPRQKEALLLKQSGMTWKDIAKRWNVTSNAAAQYAYKGSRVLKEKLRVQLNL